MNQPIRVLHIFGRMNRGGAETFIMHVYRHIDRSSIQFDFGVHSEQPGHYDEEIRSLGGRIFVLPRPRLATLAAYNRTLAQLLRNKGPFAAIHSHVHFYSGIPLAIAASAGIPLRIAHSHNISDGKKNTLPRRLYRWYMRHQIFRHATHMVGCSRMACEGLYGDTKCWQDNRVQVVHYGIDLTPFESLPKDQNLFRDKIGLSKDCNLIGHVGRFDVQKNHTFLIEIFEALLSRLPNTCLVLVGDGPLRPEIERLVKAKGIQNRVFFMGVRADVPEIMGCLDVFIFPSLWEGLPVVLTEAQAAGLPCLISDIITKEVDINIGLLQFVSLKENINVWVEHVLKALKINRPNWSIRKKALIRNGFDIKGPALTLERIYESHQHD